MYRHRQVNVQMLLDESIKRGGDGNERFRLVPLELFSGGWVENSNNITHHKLVAGCGAYWWNQNDLMYRKSRTV